MEKKSDYSLQDRIAYYEKMLSGVKMDLTKLNLTKKAIEDKIAFFKSDKYQDWNDRVSKSINNYSKPYKD